MLARLGPAFFLSCGRDTAARFIRYTHIDIPPQYWPTPSFSITASNLLLAFESGFGNLEGRTSQYQAFACAIAWWQIPALLHRPVAIASISQYFHCFHPTPRGGLRLGFVGQELLNTVQLIKYFVL